MFCVQPFHRNVLSVSLFAFARPGNIAHSHSSFRLSKPNGNSGPASGRLTSSPSISFVGKSEFEQNFGSPVRGPVCALSPPQSLLAHTETRHVVLLSGALLSRVVKEVG